MTSNREDFAIVETLTSFRKQKKVTLSKCCVLILLCTFVISVVMTGLIVYNVTLHNRENNHLIRTVETCIHHSSPVTDVTTTEAVINNTFKEIPLITTLASRFLNRKKNVSDEKLNVRLPRDIYPVSYDVKLIPFIFEGNFTFRGYVTILMTVEKATNKIVLHAADLEFSMILLYKEKDKFQKGEKNVSIQSIDSDTKRQFLIINLKDNLETASRYFLEIHFVGELMNELQGFYRSSYIADNRTWWIAATQFQPTDARRAFPCFDEPSFKAKFTVNIARPKNMSSLSNMPRIGSTEVKGHDLQDYEWDHFQESVPMSTYLVAFVISNFEKLSNGNFSVWARKEALPETKYSLEVGPKILTFFEQFFQIKFPLPKIDMVALPDFSAGAMENWGLITYREAAMLFKEGISARANLQRTTTVIAHELAHQWFGNLVTPKWWSDLWLNEGFASYMEYIGTNAVRPDWKVLDQFIVDELQSVFSLDVLKSSHEISVEVNDPNEINDIFDRISYAKGATILRMVDNFLTPEIFQKGLTKYLNGRKYDTAEQDDLWTALTTEAHENNVLDRDIKIKDIMDTWTLQTGFPVLTVYRNYEERSITCQQDRFYLDNHMEMQPNKSLWWIPVTYMYKSQEKKFVWMRREPKITLIDSNPEDWLLVNINQTGYYRVNYDESNWNMLITQLQDKDGYLKIPVANRAQILDDSMNLAASGYLKYDYALNATKFLQYEREYVPWKAAFSGFDYIEDMLIRSADFEAYQNYMLDLTKNIYEEIGFNGSANDSQLTVYLRFSLLWRVCLLGNLNCINNAIEQFQNWYMTLDPDMYNPISPEVKGLVYCIAIRMGGQKEWDFAWERYLATEIGSEKEILLTALGCSREIWLLSRYLHKAITDNSGIRKQDSARVFAAVASNPVGQELAFRFLKEKWYKIKKYIGSSIMMLNMIIKSCTTKLNTEQEVEDLQRFAKMVEEEIFTRIIKQAIEQAEANVIWKKKYYDQIVQWLKENTKNT